ncbi:MAG: hypothetical protein JXQ23_11935 [Clostridia bacterium]|nr:hypothetical protein [Clostridia bacterium]
MNDFRNISQGKQIPREQYSDQPYVVIADNRDWVCVITTVKGDEGARGEHIGITRSADKGDSWTPLLFLENAQEPESAYGVLLKVPYGRIYCFYNFNKDDVRFIESSEGLHHRVDMQGYFVFRFSDDHGVTWSDRYEVPVRETKVDRNNAYQGKIRLFWTVGKPLLIRDSCYFPIHKIQDMLTVSEGWFIHSPNIGVEKEVSKLIFETLPDGEEGLKTPEGGGLIAEEQSIVSISDGSLYCVYRTVDGHPAYSISRDGGHTFSKPQYQAYADGRLMKNPRAANFIWKLKNGKFLYWFHNNGGRWYENRNPVFVSSGIEADTDKGKTIKWSQPELILYDRDPYTIISYPDFIEDGNRFYITETMKTEARCHEIKEEFMINLLNQFDNADVSKRGLLMEYESSDGGKLIMPDLPYFTEREVVNSTYNSKNLGHGLTIEMWCEFKEKVNRQILFDSRDKNHKGILIETNLNHGVSIVLNDGLMQCSWQSDDEVLRVNSTHHIAVVIDGGPRIISFIIDGRYNDGGEVREFGFGRFSPYFREANGAQTAEVSASARVVKIYGVALMTSEVIGNYNHDKI